MIYLLLLAFFFSMRCGGGGSSSGNNDTNNDTEAPSVPGNLIGTPISSSRINLNWEASSDNVAVTAYHIFRDSVRIDSTLELTYTDSGLSTDTAYVYQILAVDQAGNESALSDAAHLTTLQEGLALFVDNATGDDTDDGSHALPVATIEQALVLAESETTIYVNDTGTPYQGVCVNKPGISIIGIGGSPTIDQYVACDGRNALLYSRADDTLFENFDLDASAYAGESVRALIFSGLPDKTIHRNIASNIHIVLTTDRDAIGVDTESNAGLTIDSNIYLENTLFEDTGENWISFSHWQNSMGYDHNSIQTTMSLLFLDPSDNGYYLLNTSPARNSAEDRNVATDIDGNARPQGSKPDIGAREYIE